MSQQPHHKAVHRPAGGGGGAGLHTGALYGLQTTNRRSIHLAAHSLALQVEVQEIFGEEGLVTALAMEAVSGVGLAVGLVGHLLEELLAALLAAELLVASV